MTKRNWRGVKLTFSTQYYKDDVVVKGRLTVYHGMMLVAVHEIAGIKDYRKMEFYHSRVPCSASLYDLKRKPCDKIRVRFVPCNENGDYAGWYTKPAHRRSLAGLCHVHSCLSVNFGPSPIRCTVRV